MEHTLAAVQVFDKFGDAATVVKLVILDRIRSLVGKPYSQTLIQEREFTQSLRQRVVVVHGGIHDGGVGFEGYLGAGLLAGLPGLLQRTLGDSGSVLLLPGESVAPDLELETLR